VPCTAKLCSWNKPSEGACYEIKVPIWTHMYSKPDCERNHGHQRMVACLRDTNTRATVPWHTAKSAAVLDFSRDAGERPANRAALWEALADAFAEEEAAENGRLNASRTGKWKRWQNEGGDDANDPVTHMRVDASIDEETDGELDVWGTDDESSP
jgi:hypothetical protein